MTALIDAWKWSKEDKILHVLPLHHVHGVVNALGCPLMSGAECEFVYPFNAARTWERLASGDLTVFMAVPTIYHKLIQEYERMSAETQREMSECVSALRLMVSGSAALPPSVLTRPRYLELV